MIHTGFFAASIDEMRGCGTWSEGGGGGGERYVCVDTLDSVR